MKLIDANLLIYAHNTNAPEHQLARAWTEGTLSRPEPVGLAWLAILAFLMVLASAVLTVDSIFLFWFAAFMMMAVGTFVLMEMRRSGHAASIQARHTHDPQEHRHLAFSLARVAPA